MGVYNLFSYLPIYGRLFRFQFLATENDSTVSILEHMFLYVGTFLFRGIHSHELKDTCISDVRRYCQIVFQKVVILHLSTSSV